MDYQVQLDVFEGPLDLLLYLIRKEKVDIYDIPISQITERYIEYLDLMRELSVDVTADFLVMAAQLTYIKSRMLLPRDEEGEEEEGGEDPREELVRRLIEYMKYKSATTKLLERDILGRDVFTREAVPEAEETREEEVEETGLYELIEAFRRVLTLTPAQTEHRVNARRITVREMIGNLCERLKGTGSVLFEELFEAGSSRNVLVVTFMSILELVRLKALKIEQQAQGGPLRIVTTRLMADTEQLLAKAALGYGPAPEKSAGEKGDAPRNAEEIEGEPGGKPAAPKE